MATITSVRKGTKTLGYNVDTYFVAWSGVQYTCSCGKQNCEHAAAVSAQIQSERTARQQHDKEIAERAQSQRESERRATAPLNYRNEGFSLLRK